MRRKIRDECGEAEILYSIGTRQMQDEARRRIGRFLTEWELDIVQEHLEEGLNFDIDTVFTTAIEVALEKTGANVKWRHPYEHKNRN